MPIGFKMNRRKAIECVLWIIRRGESNMYNICKILFAAEKYHLNTYGRPITGDEYMAMPYGTVPSWILDQIKDENSTKPFIKYEHILVAEREPIMKFFSKSDVKALEHGYEEYAGLAFNAVEEKNHKEPAWVKNWEQRGFSKCVPIPFEDFIDEEWLRNDLETISHTMVI